MHRWRRIAVLVVSLGLAPAGYAQRQADGAEGAAPRGPLAILIRNPDAQGGDPPYALADQYGRVQRLVEESARIDLDRYVGQRVRIAHDSGKTLLASQLELSESAPVVDERPVREVSPAQFIPPSRATRMPRSRVRLAQGEAAAKEGLEAFGDLPGPAPAPPLREAPAPAGSGSRAPIRLDEMPAPSVRERLDPIPAESYYGEVPSDDQGSFHAPMEHDDGYYPSEHGADCPHCNQSDGPAMAYPDMGGYDSPADCPHCNTHTGAAMGGCKTCGRGEGWCGPTCNPASRPGVYGSVEYMLWWFDGMNAPPLATTGQGGVEPILGLPSTRVIYGGELLDDPRSGLRLTLGAWLDSQRNLAVEGDWSVFETETESFFQSDPTGATSLGRPFYNIATVNEQTGAVGPPAEDVQIVSLPGQFGGDLAIQARSEFQTAGVRLRTGLCCREVGCEPSGACGCQSCRGGGLLGLRKGPAKGISRTDFLIGWRYAELDESIRFDENSRILSGQNAGATIDVGESFNTENGFHGLDLGFVYDWQSRRWGLELLSRVAIGGTTQRVEIAGSNTVAVNGVGDFTTPGGLLAQSSNIGVYERERFGVLPEMSATLSYRVTQRISLTAGYTLLYWANVVRPGDQIDYSVDGRLASGALVTPTANSHPRFDWEETSLWAHGFNFGLDYGY